MTTYCLRIAAPGEDAVLAELGPTPVQNRGRSCYSKTFSPPLAVPAEGVVAVVLDDRTVFTALYAAPSIEGEGGGTEWAQLGPASADRVLQLRWRRGDPSGPVLDRAVLQVLPEADRHPGAERARVLAL